MNKWPCPHCHEELLGAVNRCWKCGGRVTPPNFEQLVTAEAVEEHEDEGGVLVAAEVAVAQQLTRDEVSLAMEKEPPRRGSPFAFDTTLAAQGRAPQDPFVGEGPYQRESKGPPSDPLSRPTLVVKYPQHQAAIGGVVASLVLGIASLVILPCTIFSSVLAVLGVACGIWGLYCERKGLAIIALLICCLSLAISLYLIVFLLFEALYPAVLAPGGTLNP